MVCDYSNDKAQKFIQNITSKEMYKCFELVEQAVNDILSKAQDIRDKANKLYIRAKAHYEACLNDIKYISGKVDDAKRKLKNTSPVISVPRMGLDGKPVADKYGNKQQIIFINPDYEQAKIDLAASEIKLEEANRDKDWTSEVVDKAWVLNGKYSDLVEAAKQALQEIEWARKCFKDEMEKVEQLAKRAMNAANEALSVNIYSRTIETYQCIPLLRKE